LKRKFQGFRVPEFQGSRVPRVKFDNWNMEPGTWNLKPGTIELGTRCSLEPETWNPGTLELGTCCSLEPGTCCSLGTV
jgi:hypothetical protein